MKNYHMVLLFNVTIMRIFLRVLTSKKDTLKIALEIYQLYFDFETTVPTDNCFDREQKNMFAVS